MNPNIITVLINELDTFNRADHQAAVQDLVDIGTPAVGPLLEALLTGSYNVKLGAVQALGRIGDSRVLSYLHAQLPEGPPRLSGAIIVALGQIGDQRSVREMLAVFDYLSQHYLIAPLLDSLRHLGEMAHSALNGILLRDPNASLRAAAAHVMGLLGQEFSVLPLRRAIHDHDHLVRFQAVWALSQLAGEQAFAPLSVALHDEHALVRFQTALALGNRGDVRAVEALLQAYDDGYVNPDNAAEVVGALAGVPDVRSVEMLCDLLSDDQQTEQTQALAARLLGEIGDPRAIDVLASVAQHPTDDTIIKAAISALARFGPPIVEMLCNWLSEFSADVTVHIMKTLGELGDERAIEPLVQATDLHLEYPIPETGAEVLAGFGRPALDAIIAALGDEDSFNRSQLIKIPRLMKEDISEPLLAALKHPKPAVRFYTALSLCHLHNWRGVDLLLGELLPLVDNLEDACIVQNALFEAGGEPLADEFDEKLQAIQPTNRFASPPRRPITRAKLERLQTDLQSDDEWTQFLAVHQLGDYHGDEVFKTLLSVINQPNVLLVRQALAALLAHRNPIPPLLHQHFDRIFKAIEHSRYWNSPAGEFLKEIGEPALSRMIEIVERDGYHQHQPPAFIACLAMYGDPRSFEYLLQAALTDDSWHRKPALNGLREIGRPAVDRLQAEISLVPSDDRRRLLKVLSALNTNDSLAALLSLLNSFDESLQHAAYHTLHQLKKNQKAAQAERILRVQTDDLRGKFMLTLLLGRLGHSSVFEKLVNIAQNYPDSWAAAEAIKGLADIVEQGKANPQVVLPILQHIIMAEENSTVLKAAWRATGKLEQRIKRIQRRARKKRRKEQENPPH